MKKEELLKLLGENENAETIMDAFVEIQSELSELSSKRQVGVKAKKELETRDKALSELGYDGGDVFDFVASVKDKLTQDAKSKVANAGWEEKVEALEKKWEAAEDKARQLERQATNSKITSKLSETLSDKVYGSKYLIESLINSGRVTEVDGDILFKDGEDYLSFDKGIEKVLSENEDNLKSNQKPGNNTISTSHNVSKKLEELSVKDVMNDIDAIAKEMGIEI